MGNGMPVAFIIGITKIASQKKKTTIVSNTTKKGEKGKKLRKPNALGFIDSRL